MFAKALRVAVLLTFTSCSTWMFSSTPPELRSTLVKVANNYLNQISSGNERQFGDMVYWPEFLGSGSSRISRAQLDEQFRDCQQHWAVYHANPTAHPLVGLKVTDVSADNNHGEIRLKKETPTPGEPLTEVRIKFIWEGTGWIIREDSLFGKDKYCAQFAKKNG